MTLSSESAVEQVGKLLRSYENGLYSDGEVISISIDILATSGDRKLLWTELPEWVQKRISSRLLTFGDSDDEIVAFGGKDASEAAAKLRSLKNWFLSQKEEPVP